MSVSRQKKSNNAVAGGCNFELGISSYMLYFMSPI